MSDLAREMRVRAEIAWRGGQRDLAAAYHTHAITLEALAKAQKHTSAPIAASVEARP